QLTRKSSSVEPQVVIFTAPTRTPDCVVTAGSDAAGRSHRHTAQQRCRLVGFIGWNRLCDPQCLFCLACLSLPRGALRRQGRRGVIPGGSLEIYRSEERRVGKEGRSG